MSRLHDGHRWEWEGNTLTISYDQYGVWLLSMTAVDGKHSELRSTDPGFLLMVAIEFFENPENMITWRYGK